MSVSIKFVATFFCIGLLACMSTSKSSLQSHYKADISTGLVGHWTFDEGTGSVAGDSSPNNYKGALEGKPEWVDGIIGKALDFNGKDHAIDINQSILSEKSPLSISIWLAPEDNDGLGTILSHSFLNEGGAAFIISYQARYDRILFAETSIPGVSLLRNYQPTGSWQHLVWVLDGKGGQKVYLDGREQVDLTRQKSGISTKPGTFFIGARGIQNGKLLDPFQGKMDDLRIYNRPLTTVDIQALYRQGSGIALSRPSPPVIHTSGGRYREPVVLTISADPGQEIYYSLDGSKPTTSSPKYTGPVLINESTTVKAICFDGLASEEKSEDYIIRGSRISSAPDRNSVLPQKEQHQIILRNYLKLLSVEDFAVSLAPVKWNDSYAKNADEVFRIYNAFAHTGREVADTWAIRMPARSFTLSAIEKGGKINMSEISIHALAAAWWATWDYPGNPYRPGTPNYEPVMMRALVMGMVELLMLEDYWENRKVRSDYLGGNLIAPAYAYEKGKDLLPSEVQKAYETVLRRLFFALEETIPWGPGGTDMESFQFVSMWYIAHAIDDDDLMKRWKSRTKQVLDRIMDADNATHKHGGGTDISYDGILRYFLLWTAVISKDPDILQILEQMEALKSQLTFPEPDGQASGPSHWNTGTTMDAPNDQWRTAFRDVTAGMLSDNMKYLPAVREVGWYENGRLKSEQELRRELPSIVSLMNRRSRPNTPHSEISEVWEEMHWIGMTNYLWDNYDAGYFDRLRRLYSNNDQNLLPPVLRKQNYIQQYGDDFLTFKFDDFAGAIHTGDVHNLWNKTVSGLSGGALSAFWTQETGSVIQGKSRGAQSKISDTWEGPQGPLNWSTHAVTGRNSKGQAFSSARILQPTRSIQVQGKSYATVTVSGEIGPEETDPFDALSGTIAYQRNFEVSPDGVNITTRLNTDSREDVAELWEILPLFVKYNDREEDPKARMKVSFKRNNRWFSSTPSGADRVSSVRLERFGHTVYIHFDEPQLVQISPAPWKTDKATYMNLMIDLLRGRDTIPGKVAVSYVISTKQ